MATTAPHHTRDAGAAVGDNGNEYLHPRWLRFSKDERLELRFWRSQHSALIEDGWVAIRGMLGIYTFCLVFAFLVVNLGALRIPLGLGFGVYACGAAICALTVVWVRPKLKVLPEMHRVKTPREMRFDEYVVVATTYFHFLVVWSQPDALLFDTCAASPNDADLLDCGIFSFRAGGFRIAIAFTYALMTGILKMPLRTKLCFISAVCAANGVREALALDGSTVDGLHHGLALYTWAFTVAYCFPLGWGSIIAWLLERQHRRLFLADLHQERRIMEQDSRIRSQKGELLTMRNKLHEAQKLIDTCMSESAALLDPLQIPYKDLCFDEKSKLGEGAFGTVWRARLRDERDVAVKTMRVAKITKREVNNFRSELIIMAPLRHENLVELIGGVWTEGADKICIVLEFCPNGALDGLLQRNSEVQHTWKSAFHLIVLGMARCLRYLHFEVKGESLIHRDVKPANVLISEQMTAKVADFGESRRFNQKEAEDAKENHDGEDILTMTLVGTQLYCAPEILRGEAYNSSVDVYAFAITLFEVVCVSLGLTMEEIRKLQRASQSRVIIGGRPRPPPALLHCHRLWTMIEGAWSQEPPRRPTFREICDSLEGGGELWLGSLNQDKGARSLPSETFTLVQRHNGDTSTSGCGVTGLVSSFSDQLVDLAAQLQGAEEHAARESLRSCLQAMLEETANARFGAVVESSTKTATWRKSV